MKRLLKKILENFFWSKGILLGNKSRIKRGIIFQKDNLKIGDYVYIGPDCYIHAGGGVTIGDGTLIAPKVKIWSVNHKYDNLDILPYTREVLKHSVSIGKACWIGLDVKICPNITIGDGVVVAMGSVVTKDVPDFAIIGGNPAKILKMRYETESEKMQLKNIIINGGYYGKKYF